VSFQFVVFCLYAASAFTGATLSSFTSADPVAVQAVCLTIPTLFIGVILFSMRRAHLLVRIAGKATSIAMGFLNFAFLAALACWPTAWAAQALGSTLDRGSIAAILLLTSGLAALYGLINAGWLRVTRYTVCLQHLPAWWQGREVALVSDLHVGVIRGTNFVRRIVDRLNALKPTVVFISGDLFDGAKVDVVDSVEPWRSLRASAGAYFVTGNHDEFGDRTRYLRALTGVGVQVLDNEKRVVEGLQVVGIHDAETHRPALFETLLERARIDRSLPSILLAHRPENLEAAERAGVSLQLSGHTHAGQFPLWTVIVRTIYGRFAYGLHRHGSLQVVTSSGAGTGGPPFRVGTRSEIVLLRLESM